MKKYIIHDIEFVKSYNKLTNRSINSSTLNKTIVFIKKHRQSGIIIHISKKNSKNFLPLPLLPTQCLVLLKHFLKLEKPEFESSSKHGFEANQTSGSIFFQALISASQQASKQELLSRNTNQTMPSDVHISLNP
jgi:hypothetical protein